MKELLIRGCEDFFDFMVANGHIPFNMDKEKIINAYVDKTLQGISADEVSNVLMNQAMRIKPDN